MGYRIRMIRKFLNENVVYNENDVPEAEKYIDEECRVASRISSRLPQNVIEHWVNTGHLPYRSYIDNTAHSDTGSSLSEEGSIDKPYAMLKVTPVHGLNDKQLYKNSTTNSSVDTAAYILSNTHVTKKENIRFKLFKREEALKINDMNDMNINDKNNKIDTAANICDTTDSSVSNINCVCDKHSSTKIYKEDSKLKKTNVIEEDVILKLPISNREDTAKIWENNKKVNDNDPSCKNRDDFSENSIKEVANINNINKYSSTFEGLHQNTLTFIRQRKLYSGRDSPTDIIVAQSQNIDTSEKRQNSHPAFSSPSFRKSHRKSVYKRRKLKSFFNNFKNKSLEDNKSSSNSTSNDIDEEINPAKRQKTLEDTESDVDKIIFQCSGKEKLRHSCDELKKRIEQFQTLAFAHIEQKNSSHKYKLRSRKEIQNKITTVSCNTWHKMLHPVIVLERLSETIIQQYTTRKDFEPYIQETKGNDVHIKNMAEDTNRHNLHTFSIKSNHTVPPLEVKNVAKDLVDSDASTIIYSRYNVNSTTYSDSNNTTVILNKMSSSNSDNAITHQLETHLSDVKLMKMQPVVVLERLCSTGSFKRNQLCQLNNFEKELAPVVVKGLNYLCESSSNNLDLFTYDGSNKTNANDIKNRKTNTRTNHNYNHNKKLLFFQTNMSSSDSDSDASFPQFMYSANSSNSFDTSSAAIRKKSSNSSQINIRKNLRSTKNNAKRLSKKDVVTQRHDDKYMSIRDSNTYSLTNNEHSFLKKVSSIDKVGSSLQNFNEGNKEQTMYTFSSEIFNSDTSEEEGNKIKNTVKNAIINKNINNKTKQFFFCTKAFDSDSE